MSNPAGWLRRAAVVGLLVAISGLVAGNPSPASESREARDLRLVPFPKQVSMSPGRLVLEGRLDITVTDTPAARQAAEDLSDALRPIAHSSGEVKLQPAAEGQSEWRLTLSAGTVDPAARKSALGELPAEPEGYALAVTPRFAAVGGRDAAGLVWGIQTLRQLVVANRRGGALPCLQIRDWPSLRYRGFQDDITRGRSSLLTTMQREVEIGARLKMNFFTYYLEHQFAFAKHPDIGPSDGSLTPIELQNLVQYAARRNTEIIGCQQSFAHFSRILEHPQYAPLREGQDCLNPTAEGTYRLLDDMYSEQIPLLASPFFNVGCDETLELGTGPSKARADEIGVGGVYAQHLRRLHDLVTGKYGKRMMMWGDIILLHPENLPEIPKDTIMLSWGYNAYDSFEGAIAPFVQAGHDFFVCPGVNNWRRILPDFETAVINIHNYVRDGAKLGAMGMLNTTWNDDGEALAGANWHGIAWGAECAWNASTTSIGDFNRRVGGALFGEKGDHFGQAIKLLGRAPALPSYGGMWNERFWQGDWADLPVDKASAQRQVKALLRIVEPARRHLQAARQEATSNADQLDYFVFGAERMRLMATRLRDLLEAADLYRQAREATAPGRAQTLAERSLRIMVGVRDQHVAMKEQYRTLWLRENRPYALDWVLARFDTRIGRYDSMVAGLQQAVAAAGAGRGLPDPAAVGLKIVELGVRPTSPDRVGLQSLRPDAPWSEAGFEKRIGLVVSGRGVDRRDQPVEVDLPDRVGVSDRLRLVELDPDTGAPRPIPAQVLAVGGHRRLVFLIPGLTAAQGGRAFFLYFDPRSERPAASRAVTLREAPEGMKWVENDQVRLLIGPEGGHIYRWEIKALRDLDITEPGERDWAGFADVYGVHRNSPNRIEVLADGPALVRLRCTDATGMAKTFSVWAGAPWVEVTLDPPSAWFSCYDDIRVMGAASQTPGRYLFSDGSAGQIPAFSTSPLECQVRRDNVYWSAKYVAGGPLLALVTPESPGPHLIGPGGGMGGPSIELGPRAHFVIYGGASPESPKEALDEVRATLDFRRPPTVELYAVQRR